MQAEDHIDLGAEGGVGDGTPIKPPEHTSGLIGSTYEFPSGEVLLWVIGKEIACHNVAWGGQVRQGMRSLSCLLRPSCEEERSR